MLQCGALGQFAAHACGPVGPRDHLGAGQCEHELVFRKGGTTASVRVEGRVPNAPVNRLGRLQQRDRTLPTVGANADDGALTGKHSAGGVSAMAYALHCTDDSLPFVAVWYGGTIVLCTLAGAALGPRLLRW